MLPITIASMCDHTDSRVTAHILSRGLPVTYIDKLHALFPDLHIRQYDFTILTDGQNVRMLSHTTVSTMDRLLLPELLNGLEKVLYLDIDILVRGDVAEIYRLNMGDLAIAGKFTKFDLYKSGVRLVTKSSLLLEPSKAWELRRRLHRDGTLAFPTFNAGIILINLAIMRRDEFLSAFCAINRNLRDERPGRT